MLPPPRYFVYLDAVARAGSIRKAAENLHVASTALNRKILEVERDIGAPLFERLPHGVRLTAAGEVLLVTVRRSMSDLRAAHSQIERLRGLVRGTVRLGCAESTAGSFVPASIGLFQRSHPGVRFEMKTGVTASLVDALLADEVDIALLHDPQSSELVRVVCAVPQRLCAMVRRGHPLADYRSLKLSECQPYALALGDRSFGSRRLIDACVANGRLHLQVALESSTIQSLKQFSLETGAISFQYEIGACGDGSMPDLIGIPLSDPQLTKGQLVLAIRGGRMLPIAALSFLDTLSQRLTAQVC
jgi:DNA-binding transcriptional LysR family regulator